jgi:hypothetical protein
MSAFAERERLVRVALRRSLTGQKRKFGLSKNHSSGRPAQRKACQHSALTRSPEGLVGEAPADANELSNVAVGRFRRTIGARE